VIARPGRAVARSVSPGAGAGPRDYGLPMQTVRIHVRGVLHVFDLDEADAPPLPPWLPAGPYRPARVEMAMGSATRTWDAVAVWPEGRCPPAATGADPWGDEQAGGVVVAKATDHFRCRACGRRVNALYPDTALLHASLAQHRFATRCPHCAAPVDTARLHALALFAPDA